MSWEDRFSTMVKESSAKINEAKRRLHSFDGNSNITTVSPPVFQSTPHTLTNQASLRTMTTNAQLDDSLLNLHGASSAALLHNLFEMVERQSQDFDLLKCKVETLEIGLGNQNKEMQQFKERISQLVQRIESFQPETDLGTTLEEFKSEIRCELSKIRDYIPDTKDKNDNPESETLMSERLDNQATESERVLCSLEDIKNRLVQIEMDLSNNQSNVENNNRMVEKNVSLLSEWRNENMESMNRLCKLQDLSNDEVKHLRSRLHDVQDKIHEFETSLSDIRLNNELTINRRSSGFLDNDVISMVRDRHRYTPISSNEDEINSLTDSSVNLEASDHGDLSFEINELNLDGKDRERAKSQSSESDLPHSSLNSLTGSEDFSSEI